jgi:16S rRNA processing protein RimM
MDSHWLPFGVLRRPHGTEGEILLHPFNDAPVRPGAKLLSARVRLRGRGAEAEATVVAARRVSEGFLVRFDGIVGREAVAAWVGREVDLPRHSFAPPGAREFFVEDTVGCSVVRADGVRLGQVRGTFWNGGQDVMVVAGDDGEERCFPMVAEFILRFDAENRLLVVDSHE